MNQKMYKNLNSCNFFISSFPLFLNLKAITVTPNFLLVLQHFVEETVDGGAVAKLQGHIQDAPHVVSPVDQPVLLVALQVQVPASAEVVGVERVRLARIKRFFSSSQ